MSAPPRIREQDIQAHVGTQSYQRGRNYADAGRVIATRRRGDTLRALCLGSVPVPYRLHATIGDDGEIEAECTCPVGHGGRCKHVAALLLTWLLNPEAFVEGVDLEAILDDKNKEELIDLLLTLSAGNPQFEQLLETAVGGDRESPSPGAEFYRQQVETAIMPLESHWDFSSGGYGYGGEVPAIVNQGDAMIQREDWRGAAAVYRGALEGVSESDALSYDEEGSLVEAVWRCIAGLGVCLEHLDDPADREPIIDSLFETFYTDISEYGGIDLSLGAPEILITRTTPEERDELIERVQEVMPPEDEWAHDSYAQLLLELETEKLTGEEYIERSRELGLTDRLVERLLSLGRHDEALQEASGADTNELEMLVPIFERHGQEDTIEPLVQRRLGSNAPYYGGMRIGPGFNLERWLLDRYKQRGDYAAALPIAVGAFKTRPSMDGYREVRELATETGEWPSTRPDLLTLLDERWPDLKLQIHLDEGELDEAIAGVRTIDHRSRGHVYASDIRLIVADAITGDRPEAALDIYLRLADQLIEQRGRDNYQIAASLLVRARNLFDRLDRYEDWEQHIARVRSDNYRLPALQDELNRVEL